MLFALSVTFPAHADFQLSRGWFSGLSEDERIELQKNLTLIGRYSALIDAEFGPSTYRALTAFQAQAGMPGTGVLDEKGTALLSAMARKAMSRFGFNYLQDLRSQSELLMPAAMLTVSSPTDRGMSYSLPNGGIALETIRKPFSEQSFADLYASLSRSSPQRSISYSTYSDARFVVSGTTGARQFYLMFHNALEESVGFSVSWEPAYAEDAQIVALFIASHFLPTRFLQAFEAIDNPNVVSAEPIAPVAEASEATPEFEYQMIGSFAVFDDSPGLIALIGTITQSTPLEFLRALRARPEAHTLMLHSDGGGVDPALIIAHEVRQRGMTTIVPEELYCYSACAFVFLAGAQRMAVGELGVHQVWNESNDLISGQAKLSDVIEAMTDFGVAAEVVSVMLRTPPSQMHIFSPSELEALGINFVYEPAASDPDLTPAPVSENGRTLLLEATDPPSTTGAIPIGGNVQWTQGTDASGLPQLIATVEVPERDMSAVITFGHSSGTQVSQEIAVDVDFAFARPFAGGSIAGLPGILLKSEELVQGKPLQGASARKAENSFVFLLDMADPESMAMLESQPWIDLALVYASGQRAILTLENTEGTRRAFADLGRARP
ncbi:peptidoglycan-binding protein [Arsenicitalea aurantiaca]|uniref:peptidoglycan-binding protein n=1 Tax=Arsenicitalea aurantiaca TaxID=1783274 RepID=UPI001315743C|nr:peptidoglycan-binding protein [Arsenicitalea aurantiaca]